MQGPRGLEWVGGDESLVAHAGLLRLLAARTGLTGKLSAGLARRGFDPVYDRRQLLLDLALVLIDGRGGDRDFQRCITLMPIWIGYARISATARELGSRDRGRRSLLRAGRWRTRAGVPMRRSGRPWCARATR